MIFIGMFFLILLVFVLMVVSFAVYFFIEYHFKNSSSYNAEKDLQLLNTIVFDTTKRYIESYITNGAIDNKANIKMSSIPMYLEGMEVQIKEIYALVIGMLSFSYINRLQILYIRDIKAYIYMRCKDTYIESLQELRVTKRIIAREELSSKENEKINELIDITDKVDNVFEYDYDAIRNVYEEFNGIDNIDRYIDSEMDSVRNSAIMYKNINEMLAEKGVEPETFFQYIGRFNNG